MSRTLLYYPSFKPPSEQWLKDSLLYWDEVGSIVPERLQRVLKTPNIRYLIDEGVYRRFDPNTAFHSAEVTREFDEELQHRLDSPEIAAKLATSSPAQYWSLAFEKITYSSWEILVSRDLTPDKFSMSGWVRVKKTAAIIYMGLLAKYLASNDSQSVQPSTNYAEYEDIIYRSETNSKPLPGVALSFKNLLPSVAQDTELRAVVEFKKFRRGELLYLRQLTDETQAKILHCESRDEAKLILTQFQEKLELGSKAIERLMSERGIRSKIGFLRTIFNAKSPAWLAIGSSVGLVVGGLPAVVTSGAVGFVAGGSIELAQYGLDVRDRNRQAQETPFSYLYSAKQEGII